MPFDLCIRLRGQIGSVTKNTAINWSEFHLHESNQATTLVTPLVVLNYMPSSI